MLCGFFVYQESLRGCGESQSPEPPTAKAPDISIHFAAWDGNIEAVKQLLTDHS